MNKSVFGPTYEEMLHPDKLGKALRKKALNAKKDELDHLNLFNITWRKEDGTINKIVLPKALTGIEANIVVLLGKDFPSGSHKVGPAYSTLIEGAVDGTIVPGKHTILGPSTGNFGIGVSYICNLMNYDSIVIMPDNMSKERYERIKQYGAQLELTPGSESDVILTLEKTFEMARNPNYASLAQFELLPNYRFHRYVTGQSLIESVKGIGNGRIACFTSAPGSAGTLGAGDQIKKVFPEAKVVALEPYECPTLYEGGRGQHRIEGIGDKMCTLIHNIINTDFLTLIKDEQSVRGLKIIEEAPEVLMKHGLTKEEITALKGKFGISSICNILGAIKMAKHLNLGPDDNIVTIATDGPDRYQSVLEAMDKRYLEIEDFVLDRWFKDHFLNAQPTHIQDTRTDKQKTRLFKQKEKDWLKFGYSKAYLDKMKSMDFWDEEYGKTDYYNRVIKEQREEK